MFARCLTLTLFITCSIQAWASFGRTITGTYSNSFGTRAYSAFLPDPLPAHAGLVVVLHGCSMTDATMAEGIGLNEYAKQRGFVVLYPLQSTFANGLNCWNWFDPSNLQREAGEASIVIGMVQQLLQKYSLNDQRMAVAGLSAGAALASDLLGCYSDLFQGGLIHSGYEFGAAQSYAESVAISTTGSTRDLEVLAKQAFNCSPPRTTLMPVLVFQGSADPLVYPVNSERVFSFFTKLNTLISKAAGTNLTPVAASTTVPGIQPGDDSSEVTTSSFGGQIMVTKFLVNNMGHAWSGGAANQSWMDPMGPSATEALAQVFFPLPAGSP